MVSKESEAALDAALGEISQVDSQVDLTGPSPTFAPLFDVARIYALPARPYLRWIKPTFDRVLGLVALVLAIPLIALIGAVIWVSMGSPVFLAQDRVGLRGKVFRLWKFRTMAPDRRTTQLELLGENRRRTHKSADDPRITTLGRWLRATRLDEIPQLVNVVSGDLSLVGPRPEMVAIVAQYEAWQHRRHAVKPGVTGLWQISDQGDKLLRDCTEMELAYLDQVSLRTDVQILLKTIPAMIKRQGI
ncbi:MAG TPA: sugar transferase [Acidimicrobiia bacterium]|nr:sugar transferase [Acidimicrobiia bacterium]